VRPLLRSRWPKARRGPSKIAKTLQTELVRSASLMSDQVLLAAHRRARYPPPRLPHHELWRSGNHTAGHVVLATVSSSFRPL
jgi:hypothetical protein